MYLLYSKLMHRVCDTGNFFTKLSLSKIINLFKVLTGFYISRLIKIPIMPGYPVSLSVEPTTSCNLRCPQCVSGLRSFSRPTGMLDRHLINKILLQQKKYLLNLTLYFQGEPFLNPDFFNIISIANKYRIYTLTSTNGHYLTEENSMKVIKSGLDRIIISVDSFDQKTYSRYRVGGNIETVKNGITNLIRVRSQMKSKKPLIIFQFIIHKGNEMQIADLKKSSFKLGADRVAFKSMQIYDYESGSTFIPDNNKYSRYKKSTEGIYEIKNRFFNHCWKMWHSCVITWDGLVTPCCFDKDASHKLGKIGEMDLKEIWNGKTYHDFRKTILTNRSSVDICTNCSEGTKALI